MPGAVLVLTVVGDVLTIEGVRFPGIVLGITDGVVATAGLLFKGAPTAISQRWPGCPCGGFMPGAVFTVDCEVTTGAEVVIT